MATVRAFEREQQDDLLAGIDGLDHIYLRFVEFSAHTFSRSVENDFICLLEAAGYEFHILLKVCVFAFILKTYTSAVHVKVDLCLVD